MRYVCVRKPFDVSRQVVGCQDSSSGLGNFWQNSARLEIPYHAILPQIQVVGKFRAPWQKLHQWGQLALSIQCPKEEHRIVFRLVKT